MAGYCARCLQFEHLGHRDPDNHQWYCEKCWQQFCGKRRLCCRCRSAKSQGSVDMADQRWYCHDCWIDRQSAPSVQCSPTARQPRPSIATAPSSAPPPGAPPSGWPAGMVPLPWHGPVPFMPPAPWPMMMPTPPGYPSEGPRASRSRSPRGVGLPDARKYTCRFIIGIENDDEFRVVKRIIGSGGAKMKEIVSKSGGDAKLRLRGQGSGYVERDTKSESHEPLQLCISCPRAEGYKIAAACAEELLQRVYRDFGRWCADRGIPDKTPRIRMTERHHDHGDDRAASPWRDDRLKRRRGKRQKGSWAPARDRERQDLEKDEKEKSDGGGSTACVDRGEPPPDAPSAEEIEKCIVGRNEARRRGDFQEADRIRNSLRDRGIVLSDEKGGHGSATAVTSWRYWHA